jgi:hypothetical protein
MKKILILSFLILFELNGAEHVKTQKSTENQSKKSEESIDECDENNIQRSYKACLGTGLSHCGKANDYSKCSKNIWWLCSELAREKLVQCKAKKK